MAATASSPMEGVEDARPTLSPMLRLDSSNFFSLLSSDLCKMVRAHVDWNMHAGAPELVEEILDDLWDEEEANTSNQQRADRILFYKGAIEEKRMGDPMGRVQLLLAQRRQIKALQQLEEQLSGLDMRWAYPNTRRVKQQLHNKLRSYDFHSFYWCEDRYTKLAHDHLLGFERFMPEPAFVRADKSLSDAAYLNSDALNLHAVTGNNVILFWSGYLNNPHGTTFTLVAAAFHTRRQELGQPVTTKAIGNDYLPRPHPTSTPDTAFYRRMWTQLSGQAGDDLLARIPEFTSDEEADLPEDTDMPSIHRTNWGDRDFI